MRARLLSFPRATVAQRAACVRDAVVGQDQHVVERRLRLARLQIRRALKAALRFQP